MREPSETHALEGQRSALDTSPLATTLAMLRRRAAAEKAAAVPVIEPPRRRSPLLACVVLAIGAVIGWQLARPVASEALQPVLQTHAS